MIKERAIIRVSGTDVSGDAATADFTSDAIPMGKFEGITVSLWADSFTGSGTPPKVTIEASGSTDVDSFDAVTNATNISLPVVLQDFTIELEYFRVVYASNGATGGTLAYELRKI